MRPWASRGHALLLLWLVLGGVTNTRASFGLTSRDNVRALSPDFEDIINDIQQRQKVSSVDLCNMLSLHRKHKRLCRKGRGVAETLVRATRLSALECQHQFQHERWNCTLGKYRSSILEKSIKETSFMYAISSAGLVHEIARACAQGIMDRCTCDESNDLENTKTWLWGGCGDNIRYGLKFTRKFLRRSRKPEKDIRAQVDEHNSGAGIKVVRDLVKTTCKCHGVSGSCTVKTCWLQLSPFKTVGSVLKARYERSAKVISFPNHATGNVQLMKRQKPGQRTNNNIDLGRNRRPPTIRHRNVGGDDMRNQYQSSYYYFSKQGRKQRRRNRRIRRRRIHRRSSAYASLSVASSSSSSSYPSSSLSSSSYVLPPSSLVSSSSSKSSSSLSSASLYSFPAPDGPFSSGYVGSKGENIFLHKASSKESQQPSAVIPDIAISEDSVIESVVDNDYDISSDTTESSADGDGGLGNIVPLRRSDLTYIDDSPSFCRQGRYSPGTSGRSCAKGGNCDSICCGRGYNVQRRSVKKACRCEVIWCCQVKCKECMEEEEIYLCK